MNGTVVLQIPMKKSLRAEAETIARDYGFSSLQEVVRVFLAQLAARKVGIGLGEADVVLSKSSRRRYAKALRELKENKNFTAVSSVDDLVKSLNAN